MIETSFQGIDVPPFGRNSTPQNVFTMSPNRCSGCPQSIHLPDSELTWFEMISGWKAFKAKLKDNLESLTGKEGWLAPAVS